MYKRANQFIADYYDEAGVRQRKGFPTAEAAAKFESREKTRAKKAKAGRSLSRVSSGRWPARTKKTRAVAPSRARSSKSRAQNNPKS